jgi:endonuclease/exonuclease/phosphatase family metal-dependent hydrolase
MVWNRIGPCGATALAAALLGFAPLAGAPVPVVQVTNSPVRILAANLTGNSQRYEPFATRIFQGLKPDIVAIQEFNVGNNSAATVRQMVDAAFGPAFHYFRESGAQIPNGVISRWPILAAGEWADPQVSNRDFVWARLDIPGPHDLYVVSVHLHSGGGPSSRKLEADSLKARITATFPAGAYVVLAGDFNFDARTEAGMGVFKTFLVDDPVPVDGRSDPDTNNGRSKPYDYVLTSANWRTNFIPTRLGPSSPAFAAGLVFDSRVYSPLSDVAPVQSADSGNAQHMAVVKDFSVRHSVTNFIELAPPMLGWSGTELRWNSPSGITWRIELSTNFSQWTTIGTASSAGTGGTFRPAADLPQPALLRVVYP